MDFTATEENFTLAILAILFFILLFGETANNNAEPEPEDNDVVIPPISF
ncbi:hypothetical protein [Halalkalibacter flavus]|jgi:hypothetical protein